MKGMSVPVHGEYYHPTQTKENGFLLLWLKADGSIVFKGWHSTDAEARSAAAQAVKQGQTLNAFVLPANYAILTV